MAKLHAWEIELAQWQREQHELRERYPMDTGPGTTRKAHLGEREGKKNHALDRVRGRRRGFIISARNAAKGKGRK